MAFKDWKRPDEQKQPQQQEPQGSLQQRDQQKQQGGIQREPNLQKKQQQPKHQVD